MVVAVACPAPENPGNDTQGLPPPENMANAGPLPFPGPNLKARAHHGRLLRPEDAKGPLFSPEQRLLILDSWRKSAIPAGDFAPLVGISRHTIYAWKKRFDKEGPGGLVDHPRGTVKGSRLPDLTRRAILMLKESNPDYGCERISDLMARGPALQASATAVAKVLKEAGYVFDQVPTRAHPDHPREFERARPNQLWQTDLFTFILKRQNRRVYLVAFMDDHSRFIVSYGAATCIQVLARRTDPEARSKLFVPSLMWIRTDPAWFPPPTEPFRSKWKPWVPVHLLT